MTKPTSAAVIWLLAPSVAALSPPEAIQRIPPITRIKKKIIAATTKDNLISPETIPGTLSPVRLLKFDPTSFRSNWLDDVSANKFSIRDIIKLLKGHVKYQNYWVNGLIVGLINERPPKKYEIRLTTAKRANIITIPIIALVILLLAPSKACLSPPEEIH